MEPLDLEGLFWLSGRPEDKVAGRLTFDPARGSELQLIGSFTPIEQLPEGNKEGLRIHGLAGGKYFTLDESFRVNAQLQFPGLYRETFYSAVAYEGAHFPEVDLEFNAITFELKHLEQWVWSTGTKVKFRTDKGSNSLRQLDITFKPRRALRVSCPVGELELHFTYAYNPISIVGHTLSEGCSLKLRFTQPTSLANALKHCSQMQHLITIGTNEPAVVNAVSLSPSDSLMAQSLVGGLGSVKLHRPFQGSEAVGLRETIHPMHMLFTFEDIGGLEGVAKWMQTAERFGPVITSLLGNRYLPVVYQDEQLLNLMIAAEALQRIRTNKQQVNFAKGVMELIKVAGSPFTLLVPDVEKWAKDLARSRVNHLVHRGLHAPLDGRNIYLLSESLYFLVVICLLREAGIPDTTLDRIQHHGRFRNLAEQLSGST